MSAPSIVWAALGTDERPLGLYATREAAERAHSANRRLQDVVCYVIGAPTTYEAWAKFDGSTNAWSRADGRLTDPDWSVSTISPKGCLFMGSGLTQDEAIAAAQASMDTWCGEHGAAYLPMWLDDGDSEVRTHAILHVAPRIPALAEEADVAS